jgi:hypothetical protein
MYVHHITHASKQTIAVNLWTSSREIENFDLALEKGLPGCFGWPTAFDLEGSANAGASSNNGFGVRRSGQLQCLRFFAEELVIAVVPWWPASPADYITTRIWSSFEDLESQFGGCAPLWLTSSSSRAVECRQSAASNLTDYARLQQLVPGAKIEHVTALLRASCDGGGPAEHHARCEIRLAAYLEELIG